MQAWNAMLLNAEQTRVAEIAPDQEVTSDSGVARWDRITRSESPHQKEWQPLPPPLPLHHPDRVLEPAVSPTDASAMPSLLPSLPCTPAPR